MIFPSVVFVMVLDVYSFSGIGCAGLGFLMKWHCRKSECWSVSCMQRFAKQKKGYGLSREVVNVII